MKKILYILLFSVLAFGASAQVTYSTKDTTFAGWMARISVPSNFNPTDSCELFLITHGTGEYRYHDQ
jgi:hypothetical protein